jgi:hypothetical protein
MMVISLSLLSFTLDLDRGIGELPVVDILDRHRRDDRGHGIGFGKRKPLQGDPHAEVLFDVGDLGRKTSMILASVIIRRGQQQAGQTQQRGAR